jgi:hypothetical protein
MRFRKLIAIGLAAACLSEQSARAAEIEGVRFIDKLTVDGCSFGFTAPVCCVNASS